MASPPPVLALQVLPWILHPRLPTSPFGRSTVSFPGFGSRRSARDWLRRLELHAFAVLGSPTRRAPPRHRGSDR